MIRLFFSLLFVSTLLVKTSGQDLYTLTGKIIDSETLLPLIGAGIGISGKNIGTSSDSNGNYTLKLVRGKYQITISFIGYTQYSKEINLTSDISRNFNLKALSLKLANIDITGNRADENVRSAIAGTTKLEGKEIKKLPSFLGEPDIISVLKLTPGIQAGGEGNAGLYVRGGDAGQNLMVYEDFAIYNPTHLLGVFSVFNPETVEKVTINKGAKPAYYNDIASSVIDISMREGNKERIITHLNFGLLTNSATIDGPLKNSKGSFIISGRYATLGLIGGIVNALKDNEDSFYSNTKYSFNDISLKFNYNFSPKDRIFITAYHGKDNYEYNESEFAFENAMHWGNFGAALRYNRILSKNIFSDLTIGTTNYNFNLNALLSDYNFKLDSKIKDIFGKIDVNYTLSPNKNLKTGFAFSRHELAPTTIALDLVDMNYNNENRLFSNEYAAYLDGSFSLGRKTTINAGIRYTMFQQIGPYTHYYENEFGQANDSVTYKKGDKVINYHALSPNLSTVFILNEESSIKASANLSHQFIHLASVGSVSLPTDIWLPCTDYIKPQKVAMASLGYFRNFLNNSIETSVEVYYKRLFNQVDFLNGIIDNLDNSKIESNIIIGNGKAYGAEFFIKKKGDKLSGWISYTLSRTFRQFDEINNGAYFSAKYDRIHDLSVTASYQLTPKLNIAASFVYSTGNAMTLPIGRYVIREQIANQYSTINAYRMPAYHRLDFSVNYQLKKTSKIESYLNLSIFNVYNRHNTYFIYFKVDADFQFYYFNVEPKQISLFPILPSLSWKIKF